VEIRSSDDYTRKPVWGRSPANFYGHRIAGWRRRERARRSPATRRVRSPGRTTSAP